MHAWACNNQLAMMVSTKVADVMSLLYYNVITVYTNINRIKHLSLMHNLMAILLQFTETGYPFRPKDMQLSVIYTHMVDFCNPAHCCQ